MQKYNYSMLKCIQMDETRAKWNEKIKTEFVLNGYCINVYIINIY